MDWADGDGSGADAPGASGEFRPGRRALDDRLETWVSRGRELVDGVSGTRPGTRPPGRGGGGRLDGLGRWVEGKLDWLLDDREDWREPWQEADRSAPVRRSRAPLEAISRRQPPSPEAASPAPSPPPSQEWPEEDAFTVPRWRRQEPPPPPPVDPLAAAPAPAPLPGRPLPRSTRRR
jgi:hypothetical protein